jgi:hypothetical protein
MQESELSLQDIPPPPAHGDKFQHDLHDPDNSKFYVAKSITPDAGYGLFARRLLKGDSLLCQYYGRNSPNNPSDTYTIRPPGTDPNDNSKDIDAYDPLTNRVLCLAGFVNDPLDETKENAKWEYINGKLYLRATRDIRPTEQIFAHYGYEYWAWLSDRWPQPLLHQIIRRYVSAVNLTDPVWRRIIIIIIYLITCYTKNNNPRLNTNATSHPYGRTTRRKTTNLTKRNTLVKLHGG